MLPRGSFRMRASFHLAMCSHTRSLHVDLHVAPSGLRISSGTRHALSHGFVPRGVHMIAERIHLGAGAKRRLRVASGSGRRLSARADAFGMNASTNLRSLVADTLTLGKGRRCNEHHKSRARDESFHDIHALLHVPDDRLHKNDAHHKDDAHPSCCTANVRRGRTFPGVLDMICFDDFKGRSVLAPCNAPMQMQHPIRNR